MQRKKNNSANTSKYTSCKVLISTEISFSFHDEPNKAVMAEPTRA